MQPFLPDLSFNRLAICLMGWLLSFHGLGEDEDRPTNKDLVDIRGSVTYQADPQRPWRLKRYFVHGQEGRMSEAVVELIPIDPKPQAYEAPSSYQTFLMDQKDHMFLPETLVMRLGESVRFLNSESALHNVRCLETDPPLHVNLALGEDHLFKPQKAHGARDPLDITCVFHGAMKAWIFVFDHPYFQLTDRSGVFHFKDVPGGTYRMRVAHASGDLIFQSEARVIGKDTPPWIMTLNPDHQRSRSAKKKSVEAIQPDGL